jgi:predicted phosphodiesterase
MKLVFFSDIHANLPALEAFFADIDSKRPDAVFCLGDLVGYNIWPNEVINEIRKRSIPTIAGNYDFGIGRTSDDCGCAYKTDHEKANGAVSISYTNQVVKSDERKYLRSLPSHIRMEYQLNEEKFDVLGVHGSPRKVNEYLFVDRDEKSLLRIMEQANAHIMLFGHTHKPYHRILKDEHGRYRHAINIGSVGKPKDGDTRGGYVMITLDESFSLSASDSIKVDFIRFEYDIEKAAKAVEDSPLPNEYADMLRKAY